MPKKTGKLIKITNIAEENLQSSERLEKFQRRFQEKCDL